MPLDEAAKGYDVEEIVDSSGPDPRSPRLRPRAGHNPPRHKAAERARGRPRAGKADGLRGRVQGGGHAPYARGLRRWHARLHRAGDPGRRRPDRAHRHLRRRGHGPYPAREPALRAAPAPQGIRRQDHLAEPGPPSAERVGRRQAPYGQEGPIGQHLVRWRQGARQALGRLQRRCLAHYQRPGGGVSRVPPRGRDPGGQRAGGRRRRRARRAGLPAAAPRRPRGHSRSRRLADTEQCRPRVLRARARPRGRLGAGRRFGQRRREKAAARASAGGAAGTPRRAWDAPWDHPRCRPAAALRRADASSGGLPFGGGRGSYPDLLRPHGARRLLRRRSLTPSCLSRGRGSTSCRSRWGSAA